MKKRLLSLLLVLVLAVSLAVPALAAGEKDENYYYFTDRAGNEMMAPKDAFAAQVVDFTPATPGHPRSPTWTPR